MKELMALVLSVGIVLLGTAPVMAAGEELAGPTQQSRAVSLVIPEGTLEISDEVIKDVQGKQWQGEAADILWGAVRGGLIEGGSYIAEKKLRKEKVNYGELAAKTLYGIATGTLDGALKAASKTIEYGGKAAKYTLNVMKAGFKAAFAGIDHVWNKVTHRTGSGGR